MSMSSFSRSARPLTEAPQPGDNALMLSSRFFLDSIGLAVSLAMIVAVCVLSRKSGARPFLSLLFLETGLYFLGDLLSLEPRLVGLSLALNLGNNLYGLPSLYLFAKESLGLETRPFLRHYLPAAIVMPIGLGLAIDTASRGMRGGAALAAFMVLLLLAQSSQLVVYGLSALRLAGRRRGPGPNWPRRVVLSAMIGYAAFLAISWLSMANLFARELFDLPLPTLQGTDLAASLVAVFLAWTVGLGAIWGVDAAAAAGPKYGGRELSDVDRAALIRRLMAILEAEEDLASPEVAPRRLAERIGEPYYLVSRAVNEGEGRSMAELVNEYRVARAKALLAKGGGETILEIALASGFQSKSTFNEVFRSLVGQTPSHYLASMHEARCASEMLGHRPASRDARNREEDRDD